MTTWTPVVKQGETWTATQPDRRIFSPYVFARTPVFATGSTAGIWDAQTKQSEVWTEA